MGECQCSTTTTTTTTATIGKVNQGSGHRKSLLNQFSDKSQPPSKGDGLPACVV